MHGMDNKLSQHLVLQKMQFRRHIYQNNQETRETTRDIYKEKHISREQFSGVYRTGSYH